MKRNSFTPNIIKWYKKNARSLPWRKTKDPYKIWISEIMLQQTTVNAVIPYYQKWIKVFPDMGKVAKSPLSKILKIWQGLGYYQRAKNIHKSSAIICAQYKGKIPKDPELLKKLPGFGPYTVGAVLSIAFGQRYPIIDANVRRVLMRQLNIQGYADASHDKKILVFLNKCMPSKEMSIFNQALMELGALVCRNREPLCNLCPVKLTCAAYKKGVQEIIPKQKKRFIEEVNAVIAVIERRKKYFIQKRPSRGLLADLWEFPGGKVNQGETPRKALDREIKEEMNSRVIKADHFMDLLHFYTQYRVKLNVWRCRLERYPSEDKSHRWCSLQELKEFPMPSGSARILDHLIVLRKGNQSQLKGVSSP